MILELQEQRDTGDLDDDRIRETLGSLRELTERTLRFPEEILRPLEGATIDVNDCVRKAINQLMMPENVQLDLRLSDDIPLLPLYSFDIVVHNLLQNGIDAMPRGGRLLVCTSVVISPQVTGGYLLLSIHDTGAGIPIDIQRRIFELNFTTRDTKGKGLGLGLWWVRTFVKRAGGDITIESTLGAGTVVNVEIPLTSPYEPAQIVNIH